MKSLEEQIKFIDTKLLPLFGIKNVIDYDTKLNLSELQNLGKQNDQTAIKIIINFNNILDEFKKVFPVKNFSFHKTDNKILSINQALSILVKTLEMTSIPFTIEKSKNITTMRLIAKNIVLDNYIINMHKMSDFRTKSKNVIANNKMTLDDELDQFFDLKNNLTSKKTVRLTGSDLLAEIKKIESETILIPMASVPSKNNEKFINMYWYAPDKVINEIKITLRSVEYNGIPIFSTDYMKNISSEMYVKIGNQSNTFDLGKFENDKNILPGVFLFTNNVSKYSQVNLVINYPKQYETLLNIQLTCSYVTFSQKIEQDFTENLAIEQNFILGNEKYRYAVMSGMYSFTKTCDKTFNDPRIATNTISAFSDLLEKYTGETITKNNLKGFYIKTINLVNKNTIFGDTLRFLVLPDPYFDFVCESHQLFDESTIDKVIYVKNNKAYCDVHIHRNCDLLGNPQILFSTNVNISIILVAGDKNYNLSYAKENNIYTIDCIINILFDNKNPIIIRLVHKNPDYTVYDNMKFVAETYLVQTEQRETLRKLNMSPLIDFSEL